MINNETKKFIEDFQTSTSKNVEEIERFENFIDSNPQILEDLYKNVNSKNIRTSEDLKKSIQNFKSSNDIFSKFLGKYKIEEILTFGIQCLNQKLNFSEVSQELKDKVGTFPQLAKSFSDKLPKSSTFTFSSNLQTVDFLKSVEDSVEKSIQNGIENFVKSTILVMFQNILSCSNDFKVSGLEVGNESIQKELVNKYGLEHGNISNFLSDLLNILSTSELCQLLREYNNSEVLKIINALVENKYSTLKNILKDEESIFDLFVLLRNSINFNICETLTDENLKFGGCFNRNQIEVRKCLLEKNLEFSKVQSLLNDLKDSNIKTLQTLLELLEKSENEEVNISNFCKLKDDFGILEDLSNEYVLNIEKSLDSLLDTIRTSYQQNISTFTQRLLKDVEVESEDKVLPNFYNSVISQIEKDYNKQFSSTVSRFSDEQGNLTNIIENSAKGMKNLNDFMNYNSVKSLKDSNFTSRKKKKIQPKLKEILENSNFYNVNILDDSISFNFPKRETENVGKLFDGKIFSSNIPKEIKDLGNYKFYAELDLDGNIVEKTNLQISTKETRLKVDSFLENTQNCQTVKVYLPLNFGLCEYSELYETSINNSQPIFPDYGKFFKQYYREFTNLEGFYNSQQIQTLGDKITQRLESEQKKRLNSVDKQRFYPYILSEISDVKSYNVSIFSNNLSEYDILYRFYDNLGLRKNLDPNFVSLIPGIIEKFFLENVWNKLRVAYYYRIHKTGECYLVKIDMNEKIPSFISDDPRYGGPKMSIEDWFSYNQLNLGQNSWNANNLWFNLQGIPILKVNPFRMFAGLKIPNFLSHQSNVQETNIFKGVIEYKHGIPANRKARETSWKNSTNPIKVDTFGKLNSLLPSYFGDVVTFSDSNVQKDEAILGVSKNVKYTKENLTNVSFTKDRNNNILLGKSTIPEDINIPQNFRIKNVLDLGEDPLKILENQGKTWFPKNSQTIEEYNFDREIQNIQTTTVKDKSFIPLKYFKGYNVDNFVTPQNSNIFNSLKIARNVNSKKNLYSYFWYNIILESLEKFIVLSDAEKLELENLYLKEDSYMQTFLGILDKFSRYISFSPLFQSVETTNQNPREFSVNDVSGEEDKGLLEVNILELVNFTPETQFCSVDNGLLRINEVKRKILENFKEIAKCFPENSNTYNIQMTVAFVRILIRIFSVEIVLFSIFFFSRFDVKIEEIDDVLVELTYQRMLKTSNLEKSKLLEIANVIYLEDFKEDLKSSNCEENLKKLLKINIKFASSRLKEVLYDLNSVKSNNFQISDILKENFITFVELPKSDSSYRQQSGRFISSDSSNKTDLQRKELFKRFVNFEDIEKLSKEYNIEKPGFFFEKYVIADYKNPNVEEVLKGNANILKFEEYLQNLNFSQDDNLSKYFNSVRVGIRMSYRPTNNEFQKLKNIIVKRQSSLNFQTKTLYEPGTKQFLPEHYILKQTISTKYDLQISNVLSQKNIKLNIFWKILTLEDEKFVRNMLYTDNWDVSRLTKNNEKNVEVFVDLESTFKGSLEDFSKTFQIFNGSGKFYKNSEVREFIDVVLFKTGNIKEFRRGTVLGPIPSNTLKEEVIGESVFIPIIDKFEDLNIENIKFSDISNVQTFEDILSSQSCENVENLKINQRTVTKVEFVKNFEECFSEKLKFGIVEDVRYKLLFDYIFNISKISSILILYIFQYNKITTNVDNMFSSTKLNIVNFLKNVEKDQILESSQNLTNESLFDVESIRNSTPYVLLKGLMETFDPNISVSKKVSTLVNNYRREILENSKEYLKILNKPERTEEENRIINENLELINLAKELEKLPDLPVSIPSLFFMISGVIPSPLGFSYLGFEELLNSELYKKFQDNLQLQKKVQMESGVNLDEEKYC